jgi:hypothetical protein
MNRDHAEQLTTKALDELASALEAGSSRRLTEYLAAMARFHRYSFRNALMIAAQRPAATHVAGFQAWKKLGRYVRKGEKAIAIIAPIVGRADSSECSDTEVRGFRVAHVFDVEQTEGNSLPELATISGDPGEATGRLREVIASKGIELRYEDYLCGALGRSKGGVIEVLSSLSPAQEFEVLTHELAHEILHKRDGSEPMPPEGVRELEAEAVAFAVSSGIGLDGLASSHDYVGLYRGSKEALLQSLERIQSTATEILRALLPPTDAKAIEPESRAA